MATTYKVSLDLKFKDKDGAAKALYKYVTEDLLVRSPNCFGEKAEPNETIERLMSLLLASHQECYDRHEYEGGWEWYRSEFHATYSWLDVLDEAFNAIAPYLDDESEYFRACNGDEETYKIFDGESVRIYSTYRDYEASFAPLSKTHYVFFKTVE